MLTKIERELLIEARKLISDRDLKYICLALMAASRYVDQGQSATRRLLVYIREQLRVPGREWVDNLEEWTYATTEWRGLLSFEEMRKARLAWIDWMLEEEETK